MSEGMDFNEEARVCERDERSFGLEERTFAFAKDTRALVRILPRTLSNREDAKQLIRASGSVGANFIEATEAISKKDFVHRNKISRKEAKESRYWLSLLHVESEPAASTRERLLQEAHELMLIFNAIIQKNQA